MYVNRCRVRAGADPEGVGANGGAWGRGALGAEVERRRREDRGAEVVKLSLIHI